MKAVDLTLQRFGRLVAIKRTGANARGYALWLCQCDCGSEYITTTDSLRRGHAKSCGCLNRVRPFQSTHGRSRTKEHRIWCGLKTRCYNQNHYSYQHYGARGIVVCDAWLDSFDAFLASVGPMPSVDHSLERIDNDGPYSPENCCWILRGNQGRNRRNTIHITFNGKTQLAIDWSKETGLPTGTIRERIKNGWSPEEALTTPKRSKRNPRRHWN